MEQKLLRQELRDSEAFSKRLDYMIDFCFSSKTKYPFKVINMLGFPDTKYNNRAELKGAINELAAWIGIIITDKRMNEQEGDKRDN